MNSWQKAKMNSLFTNYFYFINYFRSDSVFTIQNENTFK